MAEIVGLISAIGAIVAAGFKITRAIATVRDDFGAASASVKAIAADTTFVTMILGRIRDRIGASRGVDGETAKMLDEMVSRCKADIDEIERCLLPLIANIKSGEPMSKRQRMRWLFAKSKICSQQATLASLKLTLSLYINTVQLSDGYNIEYVAPFYAGCKGELKEEILDAIAQSKGTKTAFLNAERVDQAAAKAYDMGADDDEERSAAQNSTADASVLAIENGNSQTSPSASLSLSAPDYDTATSQLHRPDMSDFDVMQAISDDWFIKIAAHMQLQKSMAAFALVILDRWPVEDPSGSTTTTDRDPAEAVSHDKSSASDIPLGRHGRGSNVNPATAFQRGRSDEEAGDHEADDGKRWTFYSPPHGSIRNPFAPPAGVQEPAGETPSPYYTPFPPMPSPSNHGYFGPAYPASGRYTEKHTDPEVEAMKEQLAKFQEDKRRREEQERLDEFKESGRRDAEEALRRRMEEMRKAQEEAKKEIERARISAEKAAREKVDAERDMRERIRREARSEVKGGWRPSGRSCGLR